MADDLVAVRDLVAIYRARLRLWRESGNPPCTGMPEFVAALEAEPQDARVMLGEIDDGPRHVVVLRSADGCSELARITIEQTVRVHRHIRWGDLYVLNRVSGALTPVNDDEPRRGTVDTLGGQLVGLYRAGSQLFVRVDAREFEIGSVRTAWKGGARRRFRLWHGDELVLDVRYWIRLDEILHRASVMAYQDDEGHDIGRFVATRVAHPERWPDLFPARPTEP
jgi:hypothetical protein